MKFIFTIIVIIACLAEFSYAIEKEEAMQLYMAAINSCGAKTGVSEADIENLKKHEVAKTQQGKCLSSCVMKSLGIMTPDNKSNVDVLKAGIDMLYDNADYAKKATEIIDECAGETDADECEAAFKISTCWKAGSVAKGLPNAT